MIGDNLRLSKSASRALPHLLLMVALAVLILWLTWPNRSMHFRLDTTVALSAAFFTTRLLTIRLPQGDEVYIDALVGLTALAVSDITVVLASSMIAIAVELIARSADRSREAISMNVLDGVRSVALLALMAPAQSVLHPLLDSPHQGELLIVSVLGIGALYAFLDVGTMATLHAVSRGLPLMRAATSLQRPLVNMYLVHVAMAAVAVRLYQTSGAWSLPIAMLMTLILQNSFNLYLRIRRGYSDTIGAIAHAAELDRPQDSGHARRVAELAVNAARKLGLRSDELEEVGYAALLHDLGRMGDPSDDYLHSQRGASIVSSIPFLASVAPIIAEAGRPEGTDLVPAQLIRLCSRYDRLRCEFGTAEALARLESDQSAEDEVMRAIRESVGT